MNELLISKEQIENLTYKQCQQHLKQLLKTYDFETELVKLPREQWVLVDDIANTMLYLEDRIRLFEDPRISTMNPGEVIVKPAPVYKPKLKPGKPARRFKIANTVYENIHEAVQKTGIKLQTLKTYVSRKPDRYGYID
jgi:hypothetical protein